MQIALYVTDQKGKRLEKVLENKMAVKNTDVLEEQGHPNDLEYNLVNLHDEVVRQTFGGIGGAITNSSATVWNSMTDEKKEDFIRAYYDRETGIGYTLGRLSIASCDFSTHDYTYVEENDQTLDTFDLSPDKTVIIPMIHAIKKHTDLTLFASPWSPPAYMKTTNSRIGGHLKKECYSLWAKYFRKYIDSYKDNGIDIWAVTMQNEPRHHQTWESCLYTPQEEAAFLGYLGKELEGTNVKILCYDHCRERVFERAKYIYESEHGKYCDGIAHHWYSGDHFGELTAHSSVYPDKINIASEGCCILNNKSGIQPEEDLPFAETYAHDMIGCFGNGLKYYCDWNILLDEANGPYHNREGRLCSAEAPVYYVKSENQLVFRLSYYYIGHISKFVKPGAKIIASSCYSTDLEVVAFKNLDGSIVCVLLNRNDRPMQAIIRSNDYIQEITLDGHSIATAVIKKN